ncbi:cytochrome b [Teichococcus oryzae]|uniref:Cytochrome b n=1 Tax=Teichococcus oryzae TaxID=1608942 RepID=A0A5B2TLL7_9PROT|nr:cytochrome b/b6 domain-containing protein [Pseudoroseomonas oryzae]KAA2214905.1 cytochrome b [Pseudoroseomonas oryzae]
MALSWRDNTQAYGLVTRLLHWSMATLFAWQFAGMAFRELGVWLPLASMIRSTHSSVGMLLLVLVMLRGVWGLANFRNRPPAPAAGAGRLAPLGHAILYALMALVPALALARTYGAGRAFAPFGIPLFDGTQEKTSWLVSAGDALHGELAWVLLAVIGGHILMALAHRWLWRDDVLPRMAGSAGARAASHH